MSRYRRKAAPAKSKFAFCEDVLDKQYHTDKICKVPVMNPTVKRPCAFDQLRPKPGKYIDYDISQTDAKFDAGITKIHFQQTVATYQRPPPGVEIKLSDEPKNIRYFRGRPPCFTFYEEEILKQRTEEQKAVRKELKKRDRAKKKEEVQRLTGLHGRCLAAVGPTWYQELSPKQFETVERLKDCLMKDLKENTIINTQENIAYLGLVLRPNRRHIQLALKCCCGCPVEFLLILYQLINPGRTSYSINDRILLSAVVHLTMRETLREMHIRLPSPPPRRPPKPVRVQKEKPKTYESPYLIPYTFQPLPRKHTGIYRNTHVQYPESPYFSYIEGLRQDIRDLSESYLHDLESEGDGTSKPNDRKSLTDSMTDAELEIELELRLAQEAYDNLAEMPPAARLIRPSIYVPCDLQLNEILAVMKLMGDNIPEEPTEEREKCKCKPTETAPESEDGGPVRVEDIVLSTLETKEDVQRELSELQASCTCDVCKCTGKRVVLKCDCCRRRELTIKLRNIELGEEAEENLRVLCTKYIIGGVIKRVNRKPIYLIQGLQPPLRPVCPCPDNYARAKKLEDIINRQEAVLELTSLPNKFVIGGVVQKHNEKPQFLVMGIQPPLQNVCPCITRLDRVEKAKKVKLRRDAVQKLASSADKYIIGGVVMRRNGEPVFIISGVKPPIDCATVMCMQKLKILESLGLPETDKPQNVLSPEKVRKFVDIKLRQQAVMELTTLPDQYIIGGVISRVNEKPLFIIVGVKPLEPGVCNKRLCDCEDKKAAERLARPYPPPQPCPPQPCYPCSQRIEDKRKRAEDVKRRQEAAKALEDKEKKLIITGVVCKPGKKPVYIMSGVQPPKPIPQPGLCSCCRNKQNLLQEAYKCNCKMLKEMKRKLYHEVRRKAVLHLRTLPDKYVIGGVVYKPDSTPIYIIQGVAPRRKKNICPPEEKLISIVREASSVCVCKEAVRKAADDPGCKCEKCRELRHMQKNLAFLMDGLPAPPPETDEETTEQPEQTEQPDAQYTTVGDTGKEIERAGTGMFIPSSGTAFPFKFVEGTVQQPGKNVQLPEPVDEQPKPRPIQRTTCDCWEEYEESIRQYKSYRARQKTVSEYRSLEQKYIVGGVVNVPGGKPQFILSGTEPEKVCICTYNQQKELAEKQHLEAIPKLPTFGAYGITGVCETPEGPQYMLTAAKAPEDCTCMKLFKIFQEKHRPCLELYDKYKKKMDTDVETYITEAKEPEKEGEEKEEGQEELEEGQEKKEPGQEEKEQEQQEKEPEQEEKEPGQQEEEGEKKLTCKDICSTYVTVDKVPKEESLGEGDGEGDVIIEEKPPKQTCMKISPDGDCVCGGPIIFEKKPVETLFKPITLDDGAEEKEGADAAQQTKSIMFQIDLDEEVEKEPCVCRAFPEAQWKRLNVFDQIPCGEEERVYILRKLLDTLKEDGYPLAKLPECHKLPHFKLWMELRCGKFWTQEDRLTYLERSRDYWLHVDFCYRRASPKLLKLPMRADEGRKITFNSANYVRRIVAERAYAFNRVLRQNAIDNGREHFPTMFTYEFPNRTFRDVFFAYTPGKEEDVLSYRLWNGYDVMLQKK